jgi:hypothetical protein
LSSLLQLDKDAQLRQGGCGAARVARRTVERLSYPQATAALNGV